MSANSSITRSAILLTLTGGVEFGLQMAIPMIFVRHLEPSTFGQYRLLWLMAGTALAIAPAFMPQSLFYFLPRAKQGQKGLVIGNVLAYLAVASCVVALICSSWNPLLPNVIRKLFIDTNGLSAIFLGSWVLVSVMNVLPIAEGRIRWQSNSNICLAIFRTLLLAAAAIFTHNIVWVVAAMLVEALTRVTMLLLYLITRPSGGNISAQFNSMKKQISYSLPFACGNAFFLLRIQADQWVVASMLPAALFAIFSIGAVFLPVSTLIRQPLINAMMPRLNNAYANGDFDEIRRLIGKSSAATAIMLVPVAGAMFAVTPELVQIIYTERYVGAIPIMHIYLVGMMMNVFAVGHILPALDKGRFAAGNNACCLVISIVCSVIGASQWGLIGAAFGSVFTFAISELWSLKVVARTLGIGVHELMPWRAITQSLLGTWIGVGGVKLLAEMMHGTTLSILALKGLAFLIFFTGIFLALGGKKQLRLLLGHRSGPSNRRTDRNILWKNDETAVTPSGPASTKGSNDAKRISPRQQ